MALDQALGCGIRDNARQQCNRADGVVITRNRVLNFIRVAVRVENADDRDAKLARLVNGEVLLLSVNDPDCRRGLREVTDSTEALVQLGELTLLQQELLLGEALGGVVEVDLFELFHAGQTLRNRLEVGEQATEPTLIDERLADAKRLLLDRTLCLLLRADKEDRAAVGNRLTHVFVGAVDVSKRLLQVNDVAAAALGQNESLHFRVPAAGLVSEVNAAVEKLADSYNGHGRLLFWHTTSRLDGAPLSYFSRRLARSLVPVTHPPGFRRTEWMWVE